MAKIPKIKKKVNSFLISEEGRITKNSLLKMGSLLSAATLGAVLNNEIVSADWHQSDANSGPSHNNHYTLDYTDWVATIDHANHGNQAHSSHYSHGSGGWC